MTPRWTRLIASCGLALALGPGCAGVKHYDGVEVSEGPTRRELKPLDLARHAAGSVGVVETDVSRGLAFVVDKSGYLLTNRHVIEDADHIEKIDFPALSPPRTFGSVQVVYIDPSRDLALLKVDPETPLPALDLGSNYSQPISRYLAQTDRVLLLDRVADDEADKPLTDGRELEVGFVAHLGRVQELRTYNEAVGPGAFFGVSNDVRRGQSGGPVLDRYGRAVGVVTWTWKHVRGGYAIPITEAVEMLAERPDLETKKGQRARLDHRVKTFITAMYGGQVDDARRMLSPTYARSVRIRTIEVMAEAMSGDGQQAIFEFIKGLEGMIGKGGESEGGQFERMHDWVLATGSDTFITKLGLYGEIDRNQVVSFFFEFSQAYISARKWGGQGPESAIDAALLRLQTLDAARTFAFAELSSTLADRKVRVERVDLIPGVYAPQAVVTLEVQAKTKGTGTPPKPAQRLVLQMRMEWGDWYMAQLQIQGAAA